MSVPRSDPDKRQVKIRLQEVDSPETGQDFGSRAKQAASDLAFGQAVTILPRDTDRYGRTVVEDADRLPEEELVPDPLRRHVEAIRVEVADESVFVSRHGRMNTRTPDVGQAGDAWNTPPPWPPGDSAARGFRDYNVWPPICRSPGRKVQLEP
ncbi:thermonuclease family protein [Singulisphaera sp. PoT]|uniref:thermonuclease family protein n=1 Tax=Singulisphaera sp. PoT TaxID=3411797 RepID=UPI003BF5FD9D